MKVVKRVKKWVMLNDGLPSLQLSPELPLLMDSHESGQRLHEGETFVSMIANALY